MSAFWGKLNNADIAKLTRLTPKAEVLQPCELRFAVSAIYRNLP